MDLKADNSAITTIINSITLLSKAIILDYGINADDMGGCWPVHPSKPLHTKTVQVGDMRASQTLHPEPLSVGKKHRLPNFLSRIKMNHPWSL